MRWSKTRVALWIVPLAVALTVVQAEAKSRSRRTSRAVRAIAQLPAGTEHGLLLGGFDGKRWLSWKRAGKRLKPARWTLVGSGRVLGKLKAGKPVLSQASGDAYQITFAKRAAAQRKIGVIAVLGAKHDLTPRRAQVIKAGAAHRAAVGRILASKKGRGKAKVVIARVWTADLEGDGSKETLIEAAYEHPKLHYSMVLLLRAKAPATVVAYVDAAPTASVGLYQLVDLDGDGTLEIVVESEYYEGGGAHVHKIKAGKLVRVMSATDGA